MEADDQADPIEQVEITAAAEIAIRRAALPGTAFHQTGRTLPNGNYLVPLQASTVETIKKRGFPGETISDIILRVIATKDRPLQ